MHYCEQTLKCLILLVCQQNLDLVKMGNQKFTDVNLMCLIRNHRFTITGRGENFRSNFEGFKGDSSLALTYLLVAYFAC